MKSIAPVLICTLLLVAGAAASACRGGDESEVLTLEEYFAELDAISASFEERGEAQTAQFDESVDAAESEEAVLEEYEDFLRDSLELFREFLDEVDGLSPPVEAKDAHDEAIQAGKAVLDAFEQVVNVASDSESVADVVQLIEQENFAETSDRYDRSCLALEALADEHAIEVDLDCDEE